MPLMITLRDIAREAGVSVGMVSRTLNNQIKGTWPRSAAQVERIRSLAENMGYRPHSGARSARTQSFKSIGLVVVRPYANSAIRLPSFNASLVDGIHAVAYGHDYRVSFVCIDCYPEAHPDQWPRLLSETCVDGLILTDFAPPQLQTSLHKRGLPAIWLNANRRTKTDAVTFDDFYGAKTLTEHLLALGHRRIAYASPSNRLHYSVDERHRGIVAALSEAGLTLCSNLDACIPDCDFDDAAANAFQMSLRPTAVVAYSPYRAAQIERVARQAGLSVPRDVSVATWFDDPLSQRMTPLYYAGMDVGMFEAGRSAAEMLFMRMASGKPCSADVRSERFLDGESLASPSVADRGIRALI